VTERSGRLGDETHGKFVLEHQDRDPEESAVGGATSGDECWYYGVSERQMSK
jgi:hypothetical protein